MSQDSGGDIQFPSPAELLGPETSSASRSAAGSTAPKAASGKSKSPPKPKATPAKGKAKAQAPKPQAEGLVKPKQSKSRNGCVTCKQKRLKCDETKPTCQQCAKRGVTCGGYKKDFKWRPFEETSFSHKGAAPNKGKRPDGPSALNDERLSPQHLAHPSADSPETTGSTSKQPSHSPPSKYATPATSRGSPPRSVPQPGIDGWSMLSQPKAATQGQRVSPPPKSEDFDYQSILASASSLDYADSQQHSEFEDRVSSLDTFPVPAIDSPNYAEGQITLTGYYPDPAEDELDDVEEIVPQPHDEWEMVPTAFSSRFDLSQFDFNVLAPLLGQPKLPNDSAEMLLSSFDKQTCGILSIRDGLHENPWRTSILPLIHESEALYHALAAATAFHGATLSPSMKRTGVEHIRQSAQLLARDIQHMRPDIALTLTLVLAFAESWDVHVSTGIKHLQGAKQFLRRALPIAQRLGRGHPLSERILFLRNTWIYADVIARLTSLDADESTDFDAAYEVDAPYDTDASGNPRNEIDPLMGCAASLFPLIGRAANIVRHVRMSARNAMPLIAQARDIQAALFQWSPPLLLIEPEDATCAAQDAVHTAESYRWATLLYLHQAVPELPSLPADELARNTLSQLALVPSHSHTTIVQIYPLLAAGCEALHPEDREWVVARWRAMKQRLLIGNIDRCVEVVREVWARRDEADEAVGSPIQRNEKSTPSWDLDTLERIGLSRDTETGAFPETEPRVFWTGGSVSQVAGPATGVPIDTTVFPFRPRPPAAPASPYRSVPSPPADRLDPSRTVRGKQHWIGVMEDWNWEILLG